MGRIMTTPHFDDLPRPAAVLFDFDGTLVDTEIIWHECVTELLARHGAQWNQADSDEYTGKPLSAIAGAMQQRVGDPDLSGDELLDAVMGMIITTMGQRDSFVLPGAMELISELADLRVPMAVVSSSYRQLLDAGLQWLPEGTVGVIVAGDEVHNAKPHPEPYLKAARQLGVDPAECLVIEDSPPGCASANAAGAVVVGVPHLVPIPDAPRRVLRETLPTTAVELFAAHQEGLQPNFSGQRTGILQPGEWVTLTDPKGRRHSLHLTPGKVFHTTKGGIPHDELLGGPDGVVVTSTGGMQFLVLRPLMNEFMVSMPREAAVIYPKDAAQIVMWADIFPGARVLEAGVGSGALSMALLRAIGPTGRLTSYERREDFAAVARRNVHSFLSGSHPAWQVVVGDLVESIADEPMDRVILDMLAPWECIDAVAEVLVGGGILCCYVATTTQMGRVMDTLRTHGEFTEPAATETTVRLWHAEGLAIRPGHGTSGHTGFLVIARRLAHGVKAPARKRRPAPGAYGPDYHGPRPASVPSAQGS